ncbi:hypothetical protein ABVK25_010320 [Lepraria finkii]|uniref:Uncharacterized protein n=1 Tax=Lepraria finkii TaxID=1340010 RepID=A0ABR4AX74_9LECA
MPLMTTLSYGCSLGYGGVQRSVIDDDMMQDRDSNLMIMYFCTDRKISLLNGHSLKERELVSPVVSFSLYLSILTSTPRHHTTTSPTRPKCNDPNQTPRDHPVSYK